MNFLKRNKIRILIAAAAAVALTAAGARYARAAFEGQYIYGRGAVSASTGAVAVGSRYDTLEYLTNPALIALVPNNRYVFSLASYGASGIAKQTLDYYLLSYTTRGASYSLMTGNELGYSRNMFTYTAGRKANQFLWGAGLSAFTYSTPAFHDKFRDIPSDNGTGFALDIGGYTEFKNKARVGVSVQNIINNISGTKSNTNISPSLPVIYNIGAAYPVWDWLEIIAGIKRIKYQRVDMLNARQDQMIYLGAEFHTPSQKFSARSGVQSESVFTNKRKDKAIALGGGVRTDKYDVQMAAYDYLNSFSSPLILTATYKPEAGGWKEPFFEKAKPAAATQTVQTKGPQYEAQLPSVNGTPANAAPVNGTPVNGRKESRAYEKENTVPEKPPETKTEAAPEQTNTPTKPTQIAEFHVDPKIILIPSQPGANFSDVGVHWARSYVESLAKDGFYPDVKQQLFKPEAFVSRMEFYRLVFLTQLNRLFSSPITVFFKTPYPVSAQAYLVSPKLQQPAKIQEGTYEKSGPKRLVINRTILTDALKNALKDTDSPAGPYKLQLTVTNKDLLPKTLEDYVTVVDTSMNFESINALPTDEKKKEIDALKGNLSPLGIKLDYLEGLLKDIGVTRIEALRNLFQAAEISPPETFDKKFYFYDVGDLSQEDQAIVFVASRGMASLKGGPLMGGYPDMTFQPNRQITNAETAALVDRFRALTPADFEPPYNPPAEFAPAIATGVKTPAAATQSVLITSIPAKVQHPIPGKLTVPPLIPATGPAHAGNRPPAAFSSHIATLPATTKQSPSYFVISGSFLTKVSAMKEIAYLRSLLFKPFIVAENMDGRITVLHTAVGAYSTLAQARAAVLSIDPELFQPRIIMMPPGGAATASAAVSSTANPQRPKKKPARETEENQAEGELQLRGSSFIPWNLISNINVYVPDTADSNRHE